MIPQAIDAVHLLEPLYDAVTFIMLAFHTLFNVDRLSNPAGGLGLGRRRSSAWWSSSASC